MARKLVEIDFRTFWPPPQKKIGWAYKKMLSKMKKIKVVQNCLKWREYKALHFLYVCHGVPLFCSFVRSYVRPPSKFVRSFVYTAIQVRSFVCSYVCPPLSLSRSKIKDQKYSKFPDLTRKLIFNHIHSHFKLVH